MTFANMRQNHKDQFRKPAIDHGRAEHYRRALAPYKLELELFGGARTACYKVWNKDHSHYILCPFDVDIDTILKHLAAGAKFEAIDLFARARATASASTAAHKCAVCNEPGGLPSPNMLAEARKIGVELHDHNHLHPGHCRKKIREKLNYAKRNNTTARR